MPVHIAFLELIIDPACSVVFEAEQEESDIMERPPRAADEPVFNGRMIAISLAQGVAVLVAVLGVYLWAALSGQPADAVRALAFATLVVGNLGLIFVNRSWTHSVIGGLARGNRALWYVTGGTVAAIAALFAIPAVRGLFQFDLVGPGKFLVAFTAGVASIVWFEMYKLTQRRHHARVA